MRGVYERPAHERLPADDHLQSAYLTIVHNPEAFGYMVNYADSVKGAFNPEAFTITASSSLVRAAADTTYRPSPLCERGCRCVVCG